MTSRKTTEITNHLALGWVFLVQVLDLSPIFWNQLWKKKRFTKVNIINNTQSNALSFLSSDISYSFLQNVQFILTSQYLLNTSVV